MAHRSFKRPHDGLFSTRDELATSTQDQGAKVTIRRQTPDGGDREKPEEKVGRDDLTQNIE